MIIVEIDDKTPERVAVRCANVEIDLVKMLPGLRHDAGRDLFHAPLSWATWSACHGIFGSNMTVGPKFAQWTNDEFTRRVKPCMDVRQAIDVVGDFDDRLFSFQRAGVAMLACAERMLLGDEMGTGKTVQAIMALDRLWAFGHDVLPAVVICPNSTKGQWAEHFEEWWPKDLDIRIVGGSAKKRREALEPGGDVYIINWEAVRLHSRLEGYGSIRLLKCADHRNGDPELPISRCEVHRKELNTLPLRSVIVDEAHNMVNPESKQSRAVWAVQHNKTARFRFSLTGTPIADNPGDLWSIMHGLAPDEYPTRGAYVDRYCLQAWSFFGAGMDIVGVHPHRAKEFFSFFDPRFRRMPKSLVLEFLPPMTFVRRDAVMSTQQARSYKELEKQMFTFTDGDDLIIATNNLTKNIRLLQFASATCEINPETGEVDMAMPSPKIDILLEIIYGRDKPLVACAESRKLIELASEKLTEKKISHDLLVGGMTDDQRTAVLRRLKNGEIKVLLFTMKAGGVGVNMTAADCIVFLERSWSMILNVQSLARVHRIGSEQHDGITVIDVVAPGTVEEAQVKRLHEKYARLQEIVRDKEALSSQGRMVEVAALEQEENMILNSDLSMGDAA